MCPHKIRRGSRGAIASRIRRTGPGTISRVRKLVALLLASMGCCLGQSSLTFRNPLLRSGPDPWVTFRDGYYYEMNTTGVNLIIRKAKNMSDLAHAQRKVVWVPPPGGPYSAQLWAPE